MAIIYNQCKKSVSFSFFKAAIKRTDENIKQQANKNKTIDTIIKVHRTRFLDLRENKNKFLISYFKEQKNLI